MFASFDDRVLEQQLKWMGGYALPDAAAEALNETADSITTRSRHNVRSRLTVRAKYTINSIRTKARAKGGNVDRMYAISGTMSPYLPIQNVGGTIKAKRRSVPIPTVAARGGAYSRRILPRFRMNKMSDLDGSGRYFMGRPKGGNRPYGIWQRDKGGGLTLLRRLGHSEVDVPATDWFTDAIKSHAHLLSARFRRAARRIISERLPGGRK
jgi:hypothetical protein